nr:PREDICTED: gastrula zinc finger protein XlCGF67.1-like [Bemisia tabaci]
MDYTEGPFSCPKCSASYKFKTSWYNHMKLHSGQSWDHANRTQRFSCPVCGLSYKHKTNMYNHMKIHLGETYCQICDKACSNRGNYRRHMIMVHGET